jgi:hypothetical protein
MYSDILPFYYYTVVAELYFVVVTVSLVGLFLPWGGLEPYLLEMGGIGLRYDLQQHHYSLSIIMDSTNIFLELKWPGYGEPILKGLSLKKLGSTS